MDEKTYQIKIDCSDNKSIFKIGKSNISETKIPNFMAIDEGKMIYDNPG